MVKEKKSNLDECEKKFLKKKYNREGMTRKASKKRLNFVLKNMVTKNV